MSGSEPVRISNHWVSVKSTKKVCMQQYSLYHHQKKKMAPIQSAEILLQT